MSPLSQRGGDMLLYLCSISSSASLCLWGSLLSCRQPNTRRWPNAGLMLAHRMRRWPSIKPALVQRFVFAGSQFVLWWVCLWFISLQHFPWYRQSSTRRWPNAELKLAHRLRRWANNSQYWVPVSCLANINPALVQSIMTVLYHQHADTAEWSTD